MLTVSEEEEEEECVGDQAISSCKLIVGATISFITILTLIVGPTSSERHLDRVNFQKMLTLKANRVNLGHTSFLGVLRGAEPKSSVCPAQKCPQMPQN